MDLLQIMHTMFEILVLLVTIAVDGTMFAYRKLNIGGIGNGAKQIDTISSSA